MGFRFVLIFFTVQLISIDAKSQFKKPINSNDTNQIIFTDKGQSTIRIFKDGKGENVGWYYKSTEIHYEMLFYIRNPFGKIFNDVPLALDRDEGEYYIAKFTTFTTKYQGGETDEKNIKVEITPLRAPTISPY